MAATLTQLLYDRAEVHTEIAGCSREPRTSFFKPFFGSGTLRVLLTSHREIPQLAVANRSSTAGYRTCHYPLTQPRTHTISRPSRTLLSPPPLWKAVLFCASVRDQLFNELRCELCPLIMRSFCLTFQFFSMLLSPLTLIGRSQFCINCAKSTKLVFFFKQIGKLLQM